LTTDKEYGVYIYTDETEEEWDVADEEAEEAEYDE